MVKAANIQGGRRPYRIVLAAILAWAHGGSFAQAETLKEAVKAAYDGNPTLISQRAQLRALNESYVQARANLRPKIELQAGANWDKQGQLFQDIATVGGDFSMPLYTGGRGAAQITAAQADIYAGREQLREAEGQVMLAVVQAFVDVRYDELQVSVWLENVASLEKQMETAQAQFSVSEVTRTDLAQFEVSLAESRSQLALAQGQLEISRAAFQAAVGHEAGQMEGDANLPSLPPDVKSAMAMVDSNSPTVRGAIYALQAAEARVAAARGERLPAVALSGGVSYKGLLRSFDIRRAARSLGGAASVTLPIYEGGAINSRVRQNLRLGEARAADIERARRSAIQGLAQAWSSLISTQAGLVSNEARVRAAKIAFEGTQEERQVGLRSTLEVLSAQQALTGSQLALLISQRDEIIAKAQALNTIGGLEAASLNPEIRPYDPAADFRKVRYSGWTPLDPIILLIDGIGGPHLDILPPGSAVPSGATVLQGPASSPPASKPRSRKP